MGAAAHPRHRSLQPLGRPSRCCSPPPSSSSSPAPSLSFGSPTPTPTAKPSGGAGRKGIRGSAALYRQLFDRLVDHDGSPESPVGLGCRATPPSAPTLRAHSPTTSLACSTLTPSPSTPDNPSTRFRSDTFLARLGVGKPVALNLTGKLPPPEYFTQQPNWSLVHSLPRSRPGSRPGRPTPQPVSEPTNHLAPNAIAGCPFKPGSPGDRSSSLGWRTGVPRRQVFVAGVENRGPRRQVFVAGVENRGPKQTGLRLLGWRTGPIGTGDWR
jgi:hypothetical protein